MFPTITNFNFNDFVEFKPQIPKYNNWREYGISKNGNIIEFNTNYIACPCIYYVKQDELFCFSFDCDSVVEFAKNHNIELNDDFENLNDINDNIKSHIKKSVLKNYKYNVKYIDCWKKVTIDSKGKLDVIKYDFTPFTLDIKYNFNEFKKFLFKYKGVVGKLIKDKLFIPSITGGLDTRYFCGLYRNKINDIEYYYLKSVKQDGKNNVVKSEKELDISKQVLKHLGANAKMVETLNIDNKNYFTISGMFNENSNSYKNPNDIQYITKIIQHSYSNTNTYQNKVMPFIDDDYLQFIQDGEFMRILLTIILIPDLIFIPLISGTSIYNQYPNGYQFVQLSQIPQVMELLDYWGEDKVNDLRSALLC